jgi:hypothetical protein
MNVAESTNLAFRLSNFSSTFNSNMFAATFLAILLLTFGGKFDLDLHCLFPQLIHHPLSLGSEVGTGARNAESIG